MASLFKQTTTYDPIFSLLNAESVERRDELTERWKDNKLEELNFVGVVVCPNDPPGRNRYSSERAH